MGAILKILASVFIFFHVHTLLPDTLYVAWKTLPMVYYLWEVGLRLVNGIGKNVRTHTKQNYEDMCLKENGDVEW